MFQTLWPLLQNLSDADLDAIHTALNPPWDSAREAREAYKPLIRAIQEAMARLPHYRDTHYSKTAGRQWWIEPPFPLQHIQGQIGFSMKKRQMSPDHPPSMVFDLIGRIRFAPTDAWLSIGHFKRS